MDDPVFFDHRSRMPVPPTSSGDGLFDAMFVIVPLIMVAIIAFGIFTAYRNYRAAKRGGVDPFAVETELAVKAINSDLLKPVHDSAPEADTASPVSLEARLSELDDLHDRGIITAQERATARANLLAGR